MAELQRTYGDFKLKGVVQGLKRPYAFNDDDTKSGYKKQNLRFDVKTRDDNIVTVELGGLNFGNVRITPKDNQDKQTKDLDYSEGVYDEIPEDWQVFMGHKIGLEQDNEGNNDVKEFISYDAAKYVYDNLEDGDHVFVLGSLDVNNYVNQQGEEITQMRHNIRNIYKSNDEFDPSAEDFEEVSDFSQKIIVNDVDLDRKEKKAFVNAYLVYDRDLNVINFPFWVDGQKQAKFAKTLSKLPFGSELKVHGYLHSTVEYEEPEDDFEEEDDDIWGSTPSSYQKRKRPIKNVDKSYEITGADGNSVVEEKYTQEDLVDNSDEDSPFGDGNDWGTDATDESIDPDDPFA